MILQDITAPHMMMSGDISVGGDEPRAVFALKRHETPWEGREGWRASEALFPGKTASTREKEGSGNVQSCREGAEKKKKRLESERTLN